MSRHGLLIHAVPTVADALDRLGIRRRRAAAPQPVDPHHPDRATTGPVALPRMTIRRTGTSGRGRGTDTERGAGRYGAEPGARLPGAGGAGNTVAGRVRADPARPYGCAGRARPRSRGAGPVHRRLRARRARSPRRRCGSWPRWTARSSWTPARTRIIRAGVHLMPDADHRDRRDRHPAPDRRPGRPPDRRTGDRGLGLDGDDLAVRGRLPAVRRESRPDPVPGQPGAADPGALPGPAVREATTRLSALEVEDQVDRPRRRRAWRSGWRWCGGWIWS